MPPPAPCEIEIAETICFAAGTLTLEGRLHYPESGVPLGGVVIAGPHPLLGGDMDNNVVSAVASGLARRGCVVLTFNYRMSCTSATDNTEIAARLTEFWTTSHVADEADHLDDLRFAVEAMREYVGNKLPVALVGYSFGCSLLARTEIEPGAPVVMIAPTVGTHDYSAFARRTNPILVVAADTDFATDGEQLTKWFATLLAPKRLLRGQWDDHFFRGFEEEIAAMVFGFLREQWECVG